MFKWWGRTSKLFRWGSSILIVLLIIVSAYLFQSNDDLPSARNNLLVFFLVYLNIIFVCLLSFLIGRNVIKLIFDRRNSILGSKLRLRLVVAFAGLAIVTNIVLFIFAGGLLSRALENWFGVQVEGAVSGAVDVAKSHYSFLKDQAGRIGQKIGGRIESSYTVFPSSAILTDKLDIERRAEGLYGVSIFKFPPLLFADSHNAAAVIESFSEPKPDKKALEKAQRGLQSILFEEKEASQFIRAYIPVKIAQEPVALVVTIRVSPELSSALGLVNDSYKEYSQLKLYKNPLKTGYLLTLTLITVMILFSSIWFGFYISKQLTTPIQHLAEATQRVAKGDYEAMLEPVGDDEIGFLVRSFNTMMKDLKTSRDAAEQRRLFIETILSRLVVGVITVDERHTVTSLNQSACRMFGLSASEDCVGRSLVEILGQSNFQFIEALLRSIEASEEGVSGGVREVEFSVPVEGSERKIVCTGGRLTDARSAWTGSVLIFDDITEITKAQAMAVWREVARRIAHEIKNPLTPIQLSAQRLQKLVRDTDASAAVLDCASTIVENVDLIKRLANEFSNFARMPTSELSPGKLNRIISDVISLYASAHTEIVFQFVADSQLPEILMDSEQIKRLLINLIDNAVDAMKLHPSEKDSAKILIKSLFDPKNGSATIEISDNGPGISSTEKIRIFEPYFTTKKGGTGLGLAIALSIVSDHQGTIRVVDNTPRGVKFIITLPVSQKASTHRRLV